MQSVQSHLARYNVFLPMPRMRYAAPVSDFQIELAWLCYVAAEKNFVDSQRYSTQAQVIQAQQECCIAAICWATRNNWVDAVIDEYLDEADKTNNEPSYNAAYEYYIKAIHELFPIVGGLKAIQFKVKFDERYNLAHERYESTLE
jgi:hypothetical protein